MTKIRIKTTEGDIVVRLYDETPKHRGENGGYPPTKNGDIRSLLCA